MKYILSFWVLSMTISAHAGEFWTCTLPSGDVEQCAGISLGDESGEGPSRSEAFQNLYDRFQTIPECQEYIRENPTAVTCSQLN